MKDKLAHKDFWTAALKNYFWYTASLFEVSFDAVYNIHILLVSLSLVISETYREKLDLQREAVYIYIIYFFHYYNTFHSMTFWS